MSDLKKVVVFIPALNEEETIAQAIDKVSQIYPRSATEPKGYYVEILVINDGSSDGTEKIAQAKQVKVVSHYRNLGLGAATRTAMQTAREMGADVAVKLDADLQHCVEDLEKVIMPILDDKADICWGSRFGGKINYRMPLIRYIGNKTFTWLMNILTDYDISDAQTGMMAFGRQYLAVFELHGNYNPPQQLLMDANYKHMRYCEVPVVFNPRITGRSFVNLKYPFKVLINMFWFLVYANPIKVFAMIGIIFVTFSVLYLIVSLVASHYKWAIPIFFIQNLSWVSLLVGIQSFFFGVLADLIIRKGK